MPRFLPFSLAVSLLAWPAGASSQQAEPNAGRFLVLDTSRNDTLQKEMEQAAADGYRVVDGDAAYNLLVLEKVAEATPRPEYRVLSILQNQLKKASEEGFRVVPATLGTKDFPAAVIVRDPASTVRYEYLVVDAGRTATFEREIVDGAAKGYRVVGMVSGPSEHAAVLERTAGDETTAAAVSPGDRFKLLATNQSSRLQEELSDHAALGYRVLFASAAKEMLVLLERPHDVQANVEYLVVTTTKSGTLQQEMNAAASRGFRLLPRAMTAVQKRLGLIGTYGYEIGAVMEKPGAPGAEVEYRVLGARRASTLAKELGDAAAQGFVVVRLLVGYEEAVIVLERPRARSIGSLGDSLWNGVIAGAAVGALAGAFTGLVASDDCPECPGFNVPLTMGVLGAGVGSALGAGIDALLGRRAAEHVSGTATVGVAGGGNGYARADGLGGVLKPAHLAWQCALNDVRRPARRHDDGANLPT